MKTQILQLEAHDDIVSTRDKLGWGQTGRVVLVWPKQGRSVPKARILTRYLDLVMLLRHSASLGLQIALVTRDPQVRDNARRLHVPVFKSVDEAQRIRWRTRRRNESWRLHAFHRQEHKRILAPKINAPRSTHEPAKALHPALRWGLFGMAILSLLALAASVVPEAHITLQPETSPQEVTFELIANPSLATASLSGQVPAKIVDVIVEGRSSLPTTGKVLVPEKPATARVRFTNLTDKSVFIPEGLVISTVPKDGNSPVRFTTTEAGQVAAGPGKFTSLPVRALFPGVSGNLPARSLSAIEGPLGLSLTVANLLPTSGGSDLIAMGPAHSDYTRLYEGLLASLRQDALEDLRRTLPPSDMIVTPTLKLAETLEITYTPPLIEETQDSLDTGLRPATQIHLFLRLKFEVLVIPGQDLGNITARILDLRLPENMIPIPQTLEIDFFGQPWVEPPAEGNYSPVHWRVHAQRWIQARVDEDQVTHLARGRTASQVEQALQTWMPLESRPNVAIFPAWWPRLPLLATRIFIDTTGNRK